MTVTMATDQVWDPAVDRGAVVRPVVDPVVVAVIAAAVDQAWPRPRVAAHAAPRPPAWRFSGRWWSRPATTRRERPWASN